jgi:hypothetical protein
MSTFDSMRATLSTTQLEGEGDPSCLMRGISLVNSTVLGPSYHSTHQLGLFDSSHESGTLRPFVYKI